MGVFNTVEKKDSISYKEFIEEHVKKGIPVVFKNASSVWKSNSKFTPDFFRENFGSHKTVAEGKSYSMNEILDMTAKSTPENPAPYPLVFEVPIHLPELLEMITPLHMNYAQPNWFRSKFMPYGKYGNNIHLFIGGQGNQYNLHVDWYHTNAWITQLYGEKKFVVFPDGQEEYLYVEKKGYLKYESPINIVKPDLNKYPKYKYATPIEVILKPGETIYIPNGVWHTTVARVHNISLIFDQLNGLNFKAWRNDILFLRREESKIKALGHYAVATAAGIACKVAGVIGKKF